MFLRGIGGSGKCLWSVKIGENLCFDLMVLGRPPSENRQGENDFKVRVGENKSHYFFFIIVPAKYKVLFSIFLKQYSRALKKPHFNHLSDWEVNVLLNNK